MQPNFSLTSTSKLLDDVATIEAKLIGGSARPDEIDTYVVMQLELAERMAGDVWYYPRD